MKKETTTYIRFILTHIHIFYIYTHTFSDCLVSPLDSKFQFVWDVEGFWQLFKAPTADSKMQTRLFMTGLGPK